jgi:hypothetical protein
METLFTQAGGGTESGQPPAPGSDPILAGILGKKSRGETLTASERGKLAHHNAVKNGTFKPGTGRKAPGATVPAPQPTGSPAPAGNPLVAASGVGPAQAQPLPKPPPDPSLVKATVVMVLDSANGLAQSLIASKAAKAGADKETQAEYKEAVALPPATRATIVNSSPEALGAMGIDVTKLPLVMFWGGISTWALTVLMSVNRVGALEREKRIKDNEASSGRPKDLNFHPYPVDAKGKPIPAPAADPAGSPPRVT